MVKESQEWLLHQYAKFDDYFDLLNEAFADEVPYHCVYEDEYQGELGVSNDKLKKGDHFQFASGTEIKIEKIFSQWGKIIVAYSIKNEMDNMVYPTHIEDFIKLAKGSVLRWRNKEIS